MATEQEILDLLAEPLDGSLLQWTKLQHAYESCYYMSDRTRVMVYCRIETYRLWWNNVSGSKHWKYCPRHEVGTTVYEDVKQLELEENDRVLLRRVPDGA